VALSIATYNLLDLFDPEAGVEDAARNFERKLDFLAAKLRKLDSDVVGLQEVGSEEALRRLVERTAMPYVRILGTPDKRGIRCALLSRLPIVSADIHTADELPFPVFVEGDAPPFRDRLPLRRGLVHVQVQVPGLGRPVHVLVVHFKSGRGSPIKNAAGDVIEPLTAHAAMEGVVRSLISRAAEALFVRKLVDDLCALEPEAAVAVVGDFNDVYGSIVLRVVKAFGPTELFDAAGAIPRESRHTLVHFGVPRAIDHVLVTAPLFARLTSAEVLNEDLRDHDTLRKEGATLFHDSDHAPLVTRFDA
jgi:endonuclease/exonuclease/phosphatase family metal-dependent hydrolase